MRRGWLALCAVLLWSGPAPAQQVFKCTDRHGRVHYSQVKPPRANCQETAIKPAPKIGTNVEGLMRYGTEIDKTRAQDAELRQAAQLDQAQRQSRCNIARSELAMLQQASRVFYMDERGERHYQDDAQRQQLLSAAQASVARDCE